MKIKMAHCLKHKHTLKFNNKKKAYSDLRETQFIAHLVGMLL